MSLENMSLQLTIDKLRGCDNYNAWAVSVRAYLESEDLWSVVESSYDNKKEDLVKKDKRAKFIIICLIEQGLFQQLPMNVCTAKNVWDILTKTFYVAC